jgi:glutamine synthetase
MPKRLLLRPEIQTVKEMPWQKKEALVLVDVCDPKDGSLLDYAPRNLLKQVVRDNLQKKVTS